MIDWINASLTSVSMAVDAMTVNATNGLKEKNMPIWKMLIISLIFGLFQGSMPIAGYFIGYSFKDKIEPYIPWIAFALLTLLAIKSFVEWLKDFLKARKNKCCSCEEEIKEHEKTNPKKNKVGPVKILVQAIATSIDALCIGFVYLNLVFKEAILVFVLIAVVTFIFSFVCVLLAKKIACKLEKWAGLITTIVFLAVGLKILLEGIL